MPDGEALNTLTLTEQDGRTTFTILAQHTSQQDRDAHINSGMEGGSACNGVVATSATVSTVERRPGSHTAPALRSSPTGAAIAGSSTATAPACEREHGPRNASVRCRLRSAVKQQPPHEMQRDGRRSIAHVGAPAGQRHAARQAAPVTL